MLFLWVRSNFVDSFPRAARLFVTRARCGTSVCRFLVVTSLSPFRHFVTAGGGHQPARFSSQPLQPRLDAAGEGKDPRGNHMLQVRHHPEPLLRRSLLQSGLRLPGDQGGRKGPRRLLEGHRDLARVCFSALQLGVHQAGLRRFGRRHGKVRFGLVRGSVATEFRYRA